MPELPEVETTCRGISPHIVNKRISAVTVRQERLRWPVSAQITSALPGTVLRAVSRRGKYIILTTDSAYVLIHLGMSGSLRIVTSDTSPARHDHVDISFADGQMLRYTDPRRFGCILWGEGEPTRHQLLARLGPEPLDDQFDGKFLCLRSRGRKAPIKTFIMDSSVVVGVGNIYANEALYRAGIDPRTPAGKLSLVRCCRLVKSIREVIQQAIEQGGTTLRDFVGSDGKPGYFKQSLNVYGRAGQNCPACGKTLKETRIAQRSTVYCSSCQR